MNAALVAFLVVVALGVCVWLFSRREDPDAARIRRSAEERLQARKERSERRRRLGLKDDDKDWGP